MDRQQILDLYEWQLGVCFRHPARGEQPTTPVGVIHPEGEGEREIRGCADCVVTMEDIKREDAARSGCEYEPGHLGEVLQ